MRIDLYSNNPPENQETALEDTFKHIAQLPLEARERDVGGKVIFIEEHHHNSTRDRHEMHFTVRRTDNGPGLSSSGQLTTDFFLGPDDGFGEQAALIYSPKKERVVVEYNQRGPRVGVIVDYLNTFLKEKPYYNHWAREINANAYEKLMESSVSRLKVTVSLKTLLESGNADNLGLKSILDMRDSTHAGMVDISLSYGEDKKNGQLSNCLRFVKKLINEDAVKGLKANLKADGGDPAQILDFFNYGVRINVDKSNLVKTPGKRYSNESRMNALREAATKWGC